MTDRRRPFPVLAMAALGVVFGDIGTSPLYAYRAVLGEGSSTDPSVVLGLCSMMIWALLSVVTVLYVVLPLRTDNEGEVVSWPCRHCCVVLDWTGERWWPPR